MDAFRETFPGIALVWITVMAALPAAKIVGRSRHGRARRAIAYLAGFGAGLAMTFALAGIVASMSEDSVELGTLGLLGSFLGPFLGMVRASWRRTARRRQLKFDRKGSPPARRPPSRLWGDLSNDGQVIGSGARMALQAGRLERPKPLSQLQKLSVATTAAQG